MAELSLTPDAVLMIQQKAWGLRVTSMRLRYITGRGGSATEGLSAYLKQQADDFAALANDSELHKLSLDEQLSVVTAFSR